MTAFEDQLNARLDPAYDSLRARTEAADAEVDRLLAQFKDRPRIEGLLRAFLAPLLDAEDTIWDVIIKRMVDHAEGVQLDTIGKLIGQRRNGQSDANYKLFILARIAINRSDGHADDVIHVLQIVEPARFHLFEFFPKTLLLEYESMPAASPSDLYALARAAKAAGTKLYLTYDDEDGFTFCEEGAEDTDGFDLGFAPDNETSGGYLAGIVG